MSRYYRATKYAILWATKFFLRLRRLPTHASAAQIIKLIRRALAVIKGHFLNWLIVRLAAAVCVKSARALIGVPSTLVKPSNRRKYERAHASCIFSK